MHHPHKLLIQMSGTPGSGKSTLAKNLAKSMQGIVISHDLLKSFFLDHEMPFEQAAKLAYNLQWALANDLIDQGQSTAIVDSTCNYREILDQGEALARSCGYEYRYVECRIDNLDTLGERLQSRVAMRSQRLGLSHGPVDASDARHKEDYHTLFQRWIDEPYRPVRCAIIVDSAQGPEECLKFVQTQIATFLDG